MKKLTFLDIFILSLSSSLILVITCPLKSEVFTKQQLIKHGAPVKSVAWCCPSPVKYAALGGDLGNNNKYVRVYKLVNGQLVEQDALPKSGVSYPENSVYSVDWCHTVTTYLAVGGNDNMAHIFKLDTSSNPALLEYKASFTHGALINSVAWLCNCCDDELILAIAGETGNDSKEIRILAFDKTNNVITQIASGIHRAPVFSLDWCCGNDQKALLAAGGEPFAPAGSSCDGPNLRIFRLDCSNGILTNIVSWQAVEYVNPIVSYKIYRTPYVPQEPCCEDCCSCLIQCCTCPCVNSTLIATVLATSQYVYKDENPPTGALTYCVTAVDNQGNETAVPGSVTILA